jgi:hypothetical protein
MKSLIILALVGFAAAQVQVQIQGQRPQQQPQPPIQWQPAPPAPPAQRPVIPLPPQWNPRTNNWRDGPVDIRCPLVDDHTGQAVLFPSDAANTFISCWGTRGWPFVCPGNSVYQQSVQACADPGWEPSVQNHWNQWHQNQNRNNQNNWQRRPFNGDEEVADEE